MKVNCLRCGQGWTQGTDDPKGACPGCGTPDWDVEVDLSTRVGRRMEYRILAERQVHGHVMSLEMVGVWNPQAAALVELNHRLLTDYRKMKGNLSLPDAREGVIAFDIGQEGDAKGKWVIDSFRRRAPFEVRREQTSKCRRHSWAIRAARESFDLDARGDQFFCSCEGPCEVCSVAVEFSKARRAGEPAASHYWSRLRDAVLRDIGWMV